MFFHPGAELSSSFSNVNTVAMSVGDLVYLALVHLLPFLCLVIANPFYHCSNVAYVHFFEPLHHFISVLPLTWYG